jgi:hypothetical protein
VSNKPIVMFQYPPWFDLGVLGRFCLLLLVLVSIYTVYFAAVVLTRLHSLRTVDDGDIRAGSLAVLNRRSANLSQILTAMFYFFCFTLFVQLQEAFGTPDSNRIPVGLMVLENFKACFGFAALVFLVLLALHSVQWFASSRIREAAIRLGKREAT